MRNLTFATLFIVLAATSAFAEAPACFETRSFGRAACRTDAAVAPIDGGAHYLVWGGKESRGCAECTRMVVGSSTGGIYDAQGRLVETMAQENSPGARFGAQALWTGAAFFVWGGTVRQNERWVQDHHETLSRVPAALGAYYVPGARLWVRLPADGAPAQDGKLSLTDDGAVQVCDAAACKIFDMASQSWQ